MGKVQISAWVDEALKHAMTRHCRSRGISTDLFVEETLIDRLQEIDDIEDVKRVRHEATRPLAEVLEELELDGRP